MDEQYIQKKLDDLCSIHHLPALAVAVSRKGQETVLVSGVRKDGDPTPVTAGDKFHIGSCGKAVTAALIHQLIDEGYFSLDTTLEKLLPHIQVDPAYADISILQLLTHSSGVPADYLRKKLQEVQQMTETFSAFEIREKVLQEFLVSTPPESLKKSYEYSNLGYVILGMIAEHATGSTYEDLVRQRIFDKFGMNSAGFGAPANTASKTADQPWGHIHQNDHSLHPFSMDNPTAYAPVGTMHASLTDWIKFLRSLMQQEKVIDHPHTVDTGNKMDEYTDSAFIKSRDIYSHDGSNTLNYARVVLLPKQDCVFIIACNDGSAYAQQALKELTTEIMKYLSNPPPAQKPSQPSPPGVG